MGRYRYSMDITILTCNYNTPDLIVNLVKSIRRTTTLDVEIIVMDSSTEKSTLLQEHNIKHYKCRGFTHGEAVNLGFKKITTRYVLLVDSDVIFTQDIQPLFEKYKKTNTALMGKVVGDCGEKKLYPRVEPWFCFIDLHSLKHFKIEFFDRVKTKISKNSERVYDIGSTMFEDIIANNLSIGDADLSKYHIHFGGMSWRGQKYNPQDVDTDIDFGGTHPHKELYDISLIVRDQYNNYVNRLNET